MTTSDFDNYWSEIIADCPVHPEGHSRMDWNSLGMVCARCVKHTGNDSQGHYWGYCKDKRFNAEVEARYADKQSVPWNERVRELHFCCPDDCELENPDAAR